MDWNTPQPQLVSTFEAVLERAQDEKPLQLFFEKNPIALLTGLVRPHEAWVVPRPSLPKPDGTGWVPDFIVCEWSSVGPRWILVELESPRKSPATSKGVSSICHHALQQINDYRTYLRGHAEFLKGDGDWPGIHGECEGVVIIGRRSDARREKQRERLEAFRRERIEVMSYDRLIENCQVMQRRVEAAHRGAKGLVGRFGTPGERI